MMRKSWIVSLSFLLASAACGDSEENAACPPSGGAPDGGAVPLGCDLTKAPKDAPACVDDAVGVFVSASGNDASAGTKSSPYKTITKAVEEAAAKRLSRVYICEGTYSERVLLKSPISLYGGFRCADFSATTTRPKIQPTDGKLVALDIVASNVTVSSLELVGPELGAPNSIAVRLAYASAVSFVNTKVEGRAGAKGSDGERKDFTSFPSQSDLDGISANASGAGAAKDYACPGGAKTKGGKGGDNGFNGEAGEPALGGGAGGTVSDCTSNKGGGDGADASPATAAEGAKVLGALVSSEWMPARGVDGANGGPGQGGGGGGGITGGHGGGGGAGGCGGAGGGGGEGGGASIALLVVASDVSIQSSELIAGKAGDGGSGIVGQPAQKIFGFGGAKYTFGCIGGNGGRGAAGGAGGGGAGGVSAIVFFKGNRPSVKDTVLVPGLAGAKGVGSVAGSNDGVAGAVGDFVEAP